MSFFAYNTISIKGNTMKNFFKYILIVIACLGCTLLYTTYLDPSIVSITPGEANGAYQTYIVEYSNGKTEALTIKNGEDAQNITVNDLYEAVKTANGYGDDYTLSQFIEDYLTFTVEEKSDATGYLGVLSTVQVQCKYPVSLNTYTLEKGYSLNLGAGVIYQPQGSTDYYILTNYHVVYCAESISSTSKISDDIIVYLYGSKADTNLQDFSRGGYKITFGEDAIGCTYVGGSRDNDIAVLKVNQPEKITSSNARAVSVCANGVHVGEDVYAIGNPEGYGTSVTKGIVSVDSEYTLMTAVDNSSESIKFRAIRIDCAVNGGNSGGGLFNSNGELVGIVNSKLVDESIEGMAYALPIDVTLRVANNIIKNADTSNSGYATKAFFGITLAIDSSKAVYDEISGKVSVKEVIKVESINADSICKNKLQQGDIVKRVLVNGTYYTVDRLHIVSELTWLMGENTVVIFEVERLSSTTSVPVHITSDSIIRAK